MLSRKDLVKTAVLAALGAAVPGSAQEKKPEPGDEITTDDLRGFERVVGVTLTDDERKAVLRDVRAYRRGIATTHTQIPDNATESRAVFTPLGGGSRPDARTDVRTSRPARRDAPLHERSVVELGALLRDRRVTSVELTTLFLDRLKKHGPALECVITLTEARAMREARRADREIADGRYRGPLHGIPYGAKDLLAAEGYPTTWGAAPYRYQWIETDATAIRRLEEAGAVLAAKLSLGALAYNDAWFGGRTKNPWNPAQGSSGSSAGSAAAVAARLVPFALGSETLGSIMSPSVRCRVTGLRPTYGRVSRAGAMQLSYTMDKIGPIANSVEDALLVLAAIAGADPRDPAAVSRDLVYRPSRSLRGLTVGLTLPEDDPAAEALRRAGATVRPAKFSPVPDGITDVLDVESAAAFDDLLRSGRLDEVRNSIWPNLFRAARYVSGVDYLQAMRARTAFMERFEREIAGFDAVLGRNEHSLLVHTNLTGHPQIHVPWGDDGKGNSAGRSVVGRLYGEGAMARVARAVQESEDFHRRVPPGY